MGYIIAINSCNENVGVSTVTLTLAERLHSISGKSICIVDIDRKHNDLALTLQGEKKPKASLDNIMSYLVVDKVTNDTEVLIKNNSVKFKQSDISIIYSFKNGVDFTETQYRTFFESISEMYDIVLLDMGNMNMSNIIKEVCNTNILVTQCNYKFLDKLQINKLDYINEKTVILLNGFNRKLSFFRREVESSFPKTEIIGTLPWSNTVNNCLCQKNINVDSGLYSSHLNDMSKNILKAAKIKEKLKKEWFFKKKVKEDVNIQTIKSDKLGDILINKGWITKEQLDEALELQKIAHIAHIAHIAR